MNARRKTLVALTALALTLSACSSQPETAGSAAPAGQADAVQEVTVSEVIRSVFYAPLYVADGAGIFDDHGLDVTIETANGSDKVTAALISGQADVGLLGPEAAVFLRNQNSARKVMVLHQLTQRDGSFLVGRDAVSGFTMDDLAGKSIIGWRPGSMPQLVMDSLIQSSDVKPAEYVTNIQAPAMAGAFTSGQGDVIQVFEPVATTLANSTGAHVLASVGQLADPFPYTVFGATDKLLKDDPKRLAAFSAAMSEATAFVLEKPAAEVAAALASYFPDASAELLTSAIERYRDADVWAKQPAVDRQQFERLQDIMVSGGVLQAKQRVSYDDVVTTSVVDAARDLAGKKS